MAGIFDFLYPQQQQQQSSGLDMGGLLPVLSYMEQEKINREEAPRMAASAMGEAARGSYGAAMYPILAGAGAEEKAYSVLQQQNHENFMEMEKVRQATAIKNAQLMATVLKQQELTEYRQQRQELAAQHEKEWAQMNRDRIEQMGLTREAQDQRAREHNEVMASIAKGHDATRIEISENKGSGSGKPVDAVLNRTRVQKLYDNSKLNWETSRDDPYPWDITQYEALIREKKDPDALAENPSGVTTTSQKPSLPPPAPVAATGKPAAPAAFAPKLKSGWSIE